jgi:hypothetical protein
MKRSRPDAPPGPRPTLHRPDDDASDASIFRGDAKYSHADVREWRVNGHLAQVELYTADPPPDAQPFACGVWAALRIP